MNCKEILKQAGVKGVKSYKTLYKTKENMFAKSKREKGYDYTDSSWYCEIKDNGKIVINTKYYDYPQSVIEYNTNLK